MKKPIRYRDVLAMMKQMARDERVSSDALRAVLAGNIGEGPESYTQQDIARTRALAKELGWELSTVPEKTDGDSLAPNASVDRYKEEIQRLHGVVRAIKGELNAARYALNIVQTKSNETAQKRRAQMEAAGVQSVNDAFSKLTVYREALERIVADEGTDANWYLIVAMDALAFQPMPTPTTPPPVLQKAEDPR